MNDYNRRSNVLRVSGRGVPTCSPGGSLSVCCVSSYRSLGTITSLLEGPPFVFPDSSYSSGKLNN